MSNGFDKGLGYSDRMADLYYSKNKKITDRKQSIRDEKANRKYEIAYNKWRSGKYSSPEEYRRDEYGC